MEKLRHWTSRGTADFVYRIASDFVAQLETKLENNGTSQKELASRLGVTVGRVSQVLNDPGNLTLKNTVRYAQALGMKVAVVAYEDGDPDNNYGPISSGIFQTCWQNAGAPRDFFQLANSCGIVHQLGGAANPMCGGLYWSPLTSQNGTGSRPLPEINRLAGSRIQ
jgi:transcriptional regulator with XRE-family HTH domain